MARLRVMNGNVVANVILGDPEIDGYQLCPDDVGIGYTDNGDGTWTAPSPPAPVSTPKDLTFGEFQDLCYNAVNGGALGRVAEPSGTVEEQLVAGAARYGAIIKAVEADSTDLGRAILDRYNGGKNSGFKFDTTMQFLVMINAVLEAGELDEIAGSWPLV